ncbi:SH3 domain-containing protein [Kurthia massiliensis]|uniref:SH3 domain-containing protein n=1 Tax=Kurthia massiliensis TaxID=1033739 RepID=UPI0011C8BD52
MVQRNSNVRAGTGKQYKVRGVLKKGTRITVLRVYESRTDSDVWFMFKYKGKTSYISGKNVSLPYAG